MFTDFFSKVKAQARNLISYIGDDAVNGTHADVYQALKDYGMGDAPIYIADHDYFFPEKKKVETFLRCDGTNEYVYKKEGGDCDDFAWVLKGRFTEQCMLKSAKRGLALGIVWGSIYIKADEPPVRHAMNLVIDAEKNVYLIEPQSDAMTHPDPRNTYDFICL